ncbi:putative MFS transporter [Aspergillus homomorphus CBS 101889]|uniref:Putative MFS transporter n=1 Tax=Aspergillus homomorphus (strain CBS 101889) TaxID=1450537 RepID=A0A395IAQ7_ASPHC|nr:putative MFS transporter [Aspergillus homomorphus CBS 101889]RAL17045.1 putative MFS transporter [Aspergillus homomorphus CBS 101889]
MKDFQRSNRTIGLSWRSSKWFILSTIAIALFSETFLYGFLVPMLPYMLQTRLHVSQVKIQQLTSLVLAVHGIVSVVSGPIIGHFADKSSNRKLPLLLSLIACFIGTGMVAGADSLAVLFIGRVMQGIAGSSVWIVGLATVADTVGGDDMGKVEGIMMSFLYFGLIGGPSISGLLLEHVGYWSTWCLPFLLLIIDFCARLVMVESRPLHIPSASSDRRESTGSLTCDAATPFCTSSQTLQAGSTAGNFWSIILTDRRALTALFVVVSTTTVSTSFHATLPIHVQETFGWGIGASGFLFACLNIPTLLVSPVAGWLRDRFGVRYPATASAAFQAVMLGLSGLAGTDYLPWTSVRTGGGALYTGCMLAIGVARPFTMNVGPVELSSIVRGYQEESPGIFGPEGGMSRVFSLDDVAASLGTVLGPIIGGFLKEYAGYTSMCWTWSKYCTGPPMHRLPF